MPKTATRARSSNSAARRTGFFTVDVLPLREPTGEPLRAPELPPPSPTRRLIVGTSGYRKAFPITSGLIDYFPDACAAVAEVSYKGNQKHNPGEPMHWARSKSMDHADCIARHLIERGGFDGDIRHTAALAWRALALLQEELEAEFNLAAPRGAKEPAGG